jgi:hypothetical protein
MKIHFFSFCQRRTAKQNRNIEFESSLFEEEEHLFISKHTKTWINELRKRYPCAYVNSLTIEALFRSKNSVT